MADSEASRNSSVSIATNGQTVPSIAATVDTTFKASVLHVYLLGMSVVLGGYTGRWNVGFMAGAWGYFIDVFIVALGYTMLSSCLAEMASVLTFAGGAYGYVRSSVGPYFGFMTGCSELLMYNFYTMCSLYALKRCIAEAGVPDSLGPLSHFIFYGLIVAFHLRGGIYFWVAMCVLAVVSILTILLYCFAAFTQGDSYWNNSLVDDSNDFIEGGASMVFHKLYNAAWFFVGIETVSVAGGRIQEATKVVPKAILLVFVSAFMLSFWVFFATAMEYQNNGQWDTIATVFSPMSLSWHESFGISRVKAKLLTIPSNFASALGFMYGSMHSMQAMSLSGLMPSFFQPSVGPAKVPLRALLVLALLQFTLLVLADQFIENLPFYGISIMAASVVYILSMTAYITFYYKFSGMQRGFRSPFGVVGACIGIAVFSLVFLSVAVSHPSYMVAYGIYVLIVSMLYFAVVESRQFFSHEEQKHFMKAYILNANKKKKKLTPAQRFMANVKAHLCWFAVSDTTSISRSKARNTASAMSRSSGSPRSMSASASSTVSGYAGGMMLQSIAVGADETGGLTTVEQGGDRDNDKDDGDVRAAASVTTTASPTLRLPRLTTPFRNNSVAPDGTSTSEAGAGTGDQRDPESGLGSASSSSKSATNQLSSKSKRAVLAWSGKVMNIRESQQFFQLLHEDMAEDGEGMLEEEVGAELAEKVASLLPDQFQAVEVRKDGSSRSTFP